MYWTQCLRNANIHNMVFNIDLFEVLIIISASVHSQKYEYDNRVHDYLSWGATLLLSCFDSFQYRVQRSKLEQIMTVEQAISCHNGQGKLLGLGGYGGTCLLYRIRPSVKTNKSCMHEHEHGQMTEINYKQHITNRLI